MMRAASKLPSPRCAKGFTLIELLVVIAIIAILAALLLPGLGMAKQEGISTACKSNLHQIGVALRMYIDDTKTYPTYVGTFNNGIYNWDEKLLVYLANNRSVFLCGARPTSTLWTNQFFNPSYGYNTMGTDTTETLVLGLDGEYTGALSDSHVLVPSDMIAIGDCPVDSWTGIILGAVTNTYDQILDKRHNSGANVVFCDGHVEYGSQTNWMKATDISRQRWNNDHQPHPETWD